MACKHTAWLRLADQGPSLVVRQTGRLRSLVQSLPSPSSQHPAVVLLLESQNERTITANEPCTSANPGSVHLRLDFDTASLKHPLFVASAFPVHSKRRIALHKGYNCCSTVGQFTLPGPRVSMQTLLYSRFLIPFVDVFCFVYHAPPDLENIAQNLLGWVKTLDQSRAPYVPPEIMIIIATEAVPLVQVSKALLSLLEHASVKLIPEFFSALRFVKLPRDKLLSQRGSTRLSRHLVKASGRVRRKRADAGLLFSAVHLMAFSEIAFDQRLSAHPFNFIIASRGLNPVAQNLAEHLINFVSQVQRAEDLISFAAETIASSLILDHYPPGMHAFKPHDVFHMLYRDTCAYVARLTAQVDRADGFLLPSAFVSRILTSMISLYNEYLAGKSSAEIHVGTLTKYVSKWTVLKTQKTCLVCIRRVPQYKMACDHWVCENCVKVFGRVSMEDSWLFHADFCVLCHTESSITVRIPVPTGGIGVLCFDGGGVRGVAQTKILERLERRIGLPIPVQEHFKLVLGISAGALIVPAMFVKGWRPSECTSAFEDTANVAFRARLLSRVPFLSVAAKALYSLLSGGFYRAQNLEDVLKDTYGDDTKMMDSSYATSIGAKIGLAVAAISEPSTLLFTNYNGVGEEAARSGYHVYQGPQDVNVWEVARSCTAAPAYFRPKHIEGVGVLQDAGVLDNNPITMALSELHAVYPHIDEAQYLVSLGSGSTRSSEDRQDQLPGILDSSFIVRLFRAHMSLVKNIFIVRLFRAYMRDSAVDRYFRLDITFDGPEPKLDDVKMIPKIKDMVRTDKDLSQAIDEISECIVASLFYFELDSIPKQRNGEYSGSGCILCLRRRSDPALVALIDKLSRSSARFLVCGAEIPGSVRDPPFWDGNGNFRKNITFKVKGEFMISLKDARGREYPISGAPFSVEKLVAAQGLNAYFGTSDHKRKSELVNEDCGRRKRRRICRTSH
ncbi:patatin-like phospholipase-like protein [Coniochaeta sp. 2T2.1]|nr:patatin-like phospholipase-like protein [Coniochaeta sp. 2T2.1]